MAKFLTDKKLAVSILLVILLWISAILGTLIFLLEDLIPTGSILYFLSYYQL